MALKSIKEGFMIQEKLFDDMTFEFQENLIDTLNFIDNEFGQIDKEIEAQVNCPTHLKFAEDLSHLFSIGVYGQDFIITNFDFKSQIFELTFIEDEDLYFYKILLPFDNTADKEIALKYYEDLVLEYASEGVTELINTWKQKSKK